GRVSPRRRSRPKSSGVSRQPSLSAAIGRAMTTRQRPWPRAWLMTDERMGDRLWTAIDRLPIKHSGIVFRHYQARPDVRATLAKRVADICHRRSLTLAIAADLELAQITGAD